MTAQPNAFVGRAAERRVVDSALADAQAGRPSVVLIEGSAGVGKSALLDQFSSALAERFVTVAAHGDEAHGDEAMGVLRQVIDVSSATAPFTAGVQLLRHLSDLQRRGPVAVVVEDLHWVDSPSRQALLVAARRLEGDQVVILATARQDELVLDAGWERFRVDTDRCTTVPLGPLDLEECTELAATMGITLSRPAAQRLHRHCEGHPLYLQMLLTELSPRQLQAGTGELPAPRSLAATTLARVMTLPAEAVALIQALSVLGGRSPLAVLGLVAGVASPSAALDSLLDSGLVGWTPSDPATPVHFTHPLYRSAVYADLSPQRRRTLHAAAAEVGDRHSSLGHRVTAAVGHDARLIADLEAEAVAAAAASQARQAARYLEWAADLSESDDERETRLLRAATTLLEAGNIEAAQRLRARAVSASPSPRRSLVLGLFAAHDGDEMAATALFEQAAAAGAAPDLAVQALVHLGLLSTAHGRGRVAIDVTERTLALAPPGTPAAGMATVLHAIGTSQVLGSAAGVAELDQRFPPALRRAPGLDALVSGARGMMQFYAGLTAAAEVSLRRALDLARNGVLSEHLARIEALLSQTLLSQDRWNEAVVHANAALVLATEESQLLVLAQAHASLASIYAARGSWDESTQHVESAEHAARQVRTPEALAWARLARAALARARDEPAAVVEALMPLEHGPDDDGAPAFATWWWPQLIAALLDLHRTDQAAEYVDRLERLASRRPMQLDMRIALFRGRLAAAAGRSDEATTCFEAAMAAMGPNDALLDRAALMRHMAGHLLSLGRVHEATTQLLAAEELTTRVGATPYQQMVRNDLGALGVGSAGATDKSAAFAVLSERERDIVTLVAGGSTNREAAKELYLSGKTVEYHLRNVFTKLGVTSRRQLRDFLPPDLGRPVETASR